MQSKTDSPRISSGPVTGSNLKMSGATILRRKTARDCPQPTPTASLKTIDSAATAQYKDKRVISNMPPPKAIFPRNIDEPKTDSPRISSGPVTGLKPSSTANLKMSDGATNLRRKTARDCPQPTSTLILKTIGNATTVPSKDKRVLSNVPPRKESRTIDGTRYPPQKTSRSPPTQTEVVAKDSNSLQIAPKVEGPQSSSRHVLESPDASASSSLLVEHVSAAARITQEQRNRAVNTNHLLVFNQSSRQRQEPGRMHTSKCRLQEDGFQPNRLAPIGPQPAALHPFASTHVIDGTDGSGRSNTEFEDSSDIGRSPQSASLLSGHSTPVRVEFDMSSKFAEHTLKAIRTLRRQKKFDEVRKATLNLDKITGQSVADCQLFVQAGGQHYLFQILGICNRSSPHIELVRTILSILNNLNRRAAAVAGNTEVAVLTDVIQRFRDKSDIFALSSAMLEDFLDCNTHLYSAYLTNENTRRLGGIIKQCKTNTSHLQDTLKGIACLENIIHRIQQWT